MTKDPAEYPPDEALEKLIALERLREQSNAAEVCVWCGKPANGKHYDAPQYRLKCDATKVTFRACSIKHVDKYHAAHMRLYNDTLRPWRNLEAARTRASRGATPEPLYVSMERLEYAIRTDTPKISYPKKRSR